MSSSKLLLASGSPRRRYLLAEAGLRFEVQPADVDERPRPGEAPRAYAERLAGEKARAVARGLPAHPPRVVLGSDTIVVLGDRVYGKPADPEEAVTHLQALCGRAHLVVTAVALARNDTRELRRVCVESEVHLRAADEEEIRAYVAGGEPLDKAGAYALQGEGRRFVEKVVGSETNVIGLPVPETLALLADEGIRPEGRS